MASFRTVQLPADYDVLAPDGSEVRILCETSSGSMAHFSLAAGQVSRAVRHKTVGEIWFVLSGRGEMWRSDGNREEVTALSAGVSLTIPVETSFQFRAGGDEPLKAVAITMPPWPSEAEAEMVTGKWESTVAERHPTSSK